MACVLPNVGAFNLRLYRGRQTCRPFICTGRGIVHRWTPAQIPGEIHDCQHEELAGIEEAEQPGRSEEHTSELQSLMRISYAVFCMKKTNNQNKHTQHKHTKQIIKYSQ